MKRSSNVTPTILLVDDNTRRRNVRAIVLTTHGYDVQCASDLADAQQQYRRQSPDLVLMGLSGNARSAYRLDPFWSAQPSQRFGFLLNEGQNLCAVMFNGRTVMSSEGPDDLVARVAMLLERAAPLRAGSR
jgi:DNA-binding NarL/FixJ family response regulator